MRNAAIALVLAVLIWGCGEERPLEEYNLVKGEGFYAVDLPTADGTKWTYSNGEHTFSLTVKGTYMVGGVTCRVLESDSDRPTDYLSASGRYLTVRGQFLNFPLRVKRRYFYKDTSGYYEMGFDMELPEYGLELIHQVFYPRRVIWRFPMRVGDEWEVFRKESFPEFRLVRRVVSKEPVELPGGSVKEGYVAEDYVSNYGEPLSDEPVARYWLVPGAGVAKYEYLDEPTGKWVRYKLIYLFVPPRIGP